MHSNETFEFLGRPDEVHPFVMAMRFDKLGESRANITVDMPDHLQQLARHRKHGAALYEIWTGPEDTHELAFDRPPVVNPQGMIDKDYRIGGLKPSTD